MNTYRKALLLGELQWFPQDAANRLPDSLQFIQAYRQKGTVFDALLKQIIQERAEQTRWRLDDLRIREDGEILESILMHSFHTLGCECLFVFTHNKINDLPMYLAAAIGFARATERACRIIRLPLPEGSAQVNGGSAQVRILKS